MKTLVVPIDPLNIDVGKIDEAAATIKRGGLVAFPTETVYGLGADALNAEAVAGIFSAKKRPLDDPLIVHISQKSDLSRLTVQVPEKAVRLIEKFWPGPLTVVLKKTSLVPDIVTTGLNTVAVRMPSGAIALRLIDAAQTPIAAPSANLFGRPSPTLAEHVISDMEGRLDMVIDGGAPEIGIESTVVAFRGDEVVVLRPGGTTIEQIQEVTGSAVLCSENSPSIECPGKYPQHYSPNARVVLVGPGRGQAAKVMELAENFKKAGHRPGIMCVEEHAGAFPGQDTKILGSAEDAELCASRLFSIFREFDGEGYDIIIAEGIPEQGLGLAVMNRIRKAAGPA
ncbi:MAG: L-threonylcarbamoyladenylate synthase [Candidatus Omnitrophota bacterium]